MGSLPRSWSQTSSTQDPLAVPSPWFVTVQVTSIGVPSAAAVGAITDVTIRSGVAGCDTGMAAETVSSLVV